MISPSFESYSQNGEDVVLWRALHGVTHGRYIDVGANHPVRESVSMAFHARGWNGITVEPDPEFAALQRQYRPDDLVVEAAVTSTDHDTAVLHIVDGTGLSTLDDGIASIHGRASHETHDVTVATRRLDSILQDAGWAGQEIHFMSVDTEGSEREVLESIDLTRWRPWVLVVEATEPNATESTRHLWEHLVTQAGYRFCLFDGLSCFYVADEHHQQLGDALSYPACILDNYTPPALRECAASTVAAQELARLRSDESRALVDEVIRWRAQAIARWATAMAQAIRADELQSQQAELHEVQHQRDLLAAEVQALRQRVVDLQQSTSWRVTKPLRSASAALGRARGQ